MTGWNIVDVVKDSDSSEVVSADASDGVSVIRLELMRAAHGGYEVRGLRVVEPAGLFLSGSVLRTLPLSTLANQAAYWERVGGVPDC